MNNESPLITARELADRMSVDANTVRRWARLGLIPFVRLPRFGLRFQYTAVRQRLEQERHWHCSCKEQTRA